MTRRPPFTDWPERYTRTPRGEFDPARYGDPVEHYPVSSSDRYFGVALVLIGAATLVGFIADLFFHFLPH